VKSVRLTARLRLTVAYLALFIALGAGLAFANYRLLEAQLASGASISQDSGSASVGETITADRNGVTTSAPDPLPTGPPLTGDPGPSTGPSTGSAGSPGWNDPALHGTTAVAQVVDNYRSKALSTLLRTSLLSLLGATILAGLLVWLVARRALRPLQSMNATATQITEHNLDERLPTTGPRDELRDLGETFNAMLDRLEAAFAHERRLVANASHELGTPLANQRVLLEVTLDDAEATPDRLREVCATVLEQNLRAERLLAGMLTMARASQAEVHTESLRLDEALTATLAAVDTGALEVRPDLTAATIAADPFLVDRLLTNLIANATRHNVTDGWIEVAVRRNAGDVELSVRNSCVPLDPASGERLLEPFRRGTDDRTGSGSGLGLSIVAAIAAAHGWALDLHLETAGVFGATIRFPNPDRSPAA